MTSEPLSSADVDAPTRRARAVLDRARAVLLDEPSAARDLRLVADGVLDLSSAHPSGIAQLLASGRQQLAGLVRDGEARSAALLRLRRYRELVGELEDRGMACGYLVSGVVVLSGAELPVLLRGCLVAGAGTGDATLTVQGPVAINPALAREVSRRSAGQVDLVADLALRLRVAGQRPGLDPEPLLDAVEASLLPLTGVVVRRRLLVAPVSVDSERLVADLARLRPSLDAHPVLAWVGEDWAEEGRDHAAPDDETNEPNAPNGPDRDDEPDGPDEDDEPHRVEAVRDVAAAASGRLGPSRQEPVDQSTAAVIDRFVPEALDESQRRVVAAVIGGHSLAVDAPAGTGATTVAMAVAVVAAVTGRRALVVLPSRAEADLLLDRFAAHGFGDLVGREDGRISASTEAAVDASRRDAAAARYRDLLDALTRRRSPWGVSRYEALDALAAAESAGERLTSVALEQTGRLGQDRSRVEELVGELEEAVSLGLLNPRTSAWTGAAISAATEATAALSLAERLRDDLVHEARVAAQSLATGTGTAPARTVAQLRQRYRLFSGLQRTLDKLNPDVFDVPILDLVAATADSEFRAAAQYDISLTVRWKLQRRARRLIRPGIHVRPVELHELLSAAASQRLEWQSIAGGAGWAHLPSATPAMVAALGAFVDACDRLSAMHPGLSLDDADLDEVQRTAARLVQDEWALGDQPRRTLLRTRLDEAGATPVIDALTAMSAPAGDGTRGTISPQAAGRELRLAWWLGVAAATATRSPLDATVMAAEQLRAEEGAWRARASQRVHEARALPAGADAPAIRVLLPAQVSALGADERADILLLDDAGRLAFVEACGALTRSEQVVALGDLGSARPASALGVLAPTLRPEQLEVGHRHTDPLLAELAQAAGSRAVAGVPGPHPARPVRLSHLSSATGLPSGEGEVVETTDAEVDHVVRETLRLAAELDAATPPRSLAVVTLSRRHASAVAAGVRRALTAYPSLGAAFSADRAEPVVVASAEQCRGLERDVVLLSTGFTRTPHGRVLHRFGPLDAASGAGLVATAVTRARQEVHVVTGLRAGDLDPQRLRTPGSRALARVLAVAERAEGVDVRAVPGSTGARDDVPASLGVLGAALAECGAAVRSTSPVPGGLVLDTAHGPTVVDLDAEHPDPDELLSRIAALRRAGWQHVLVPLEGVAEDHERLARRLVLGSVSTDAAPDPAPDAAPAAGGGESVLTGRSADDSDSGWGERDTAAELVTDDDERILSERPPHW